MKNLLEEIDPNAGAEYIDVDFGDDKTTDFISGAADKVVDDPTKKTKKSKVEKEEVDESKLIDLSHLDKEEVPEKTNNSKDSGEYSYKELALHLAERGILSVDDEEFDDTLDGFEATFNKSVEDKAKGMLEQVLAAVNEDSKGLFQHLENGGKVEDFVKVHSASYASVKDDEVKSSVSTQEKIMRDYYKRTTKFSDDKINKTINKLKDLEELGDEAMDAISELRKLELEDKKTLAEETKRKQREQEDMIKKQVEHVKKNINDTNEFLGINITPALKRKVEENALNDKFIKKLNDNFENYRIKLAILDELGILDGDNTFVEKYMTSKGTKQVKQEIQQKTFRKNSNNSSRNGEKDVDTIAKSAISAIERDNYLNKQFDI